MDNPRTFAREFTPTCLFEPAIDDHVTEGRFPLMLGVLQ